jgi:hypothetical protein
MKLISLFIIIFTFFGCIKQKEEVAYDSIDYSWSSGFSHFRSIKIFNNGQTFSSNNYPDDNLYKYYSLSLDKESIDSISKMTKRLYKVKLDSILVFDCDHCASFGLIIKSKKGTILTSYAGDLNQKELKLLFEFTRYLDKIIERLSETSDSAFVFESKSRLILPPPPPPQLYKK